MFPRAYSCSDTEVRCQSSQKSANRSKDGEVHIVPSSGGAPPSKQVWICIASDQCELLGAFLRRSAATPRNPTAHGRKGSAAPRYSPGVASAGKYIHVHRVAAITPGTTIATEMRISLFRESRQLVTDIFTTLQLQRDFGCSAFFANLITKL